MKDCEELAVIREAFHGLAIVDYGPNFESDISLSLERIKQLAAPSDYRVPSVIDRACSFVATADPAAAAAFRQAYDIWVRLCCPDYLRMSDDLAAAGGNLMDAIEWWAGWGSEDEQELRRYFWESENVSEEITHAINQLLKYPRPRDCKANQQQLAEGLPMPQVIQIPADKRTRKMSKEEALRYLGDKVPLKYRPIGKNAKRWLNECIEADPPEIRFEPARRKDGTPLRVGGYYHIDDFPPEVHNRLR